MTSQADEAGARLPKGVKDPCRRVGRTELLQTNNYPSWSPSQEVTSITSLNNSLQGLITFPCRKFFLSSQLSPSCCPVSPNGCVSFPSPLSAVRNKDRIPGSSWVSPLHHAPTMLLGLWHGSDHNHLCWRPRRPKPLSAAQEVPRALWSAHSPPLDAAFCINSASLASFLPYFMHLDGHSGQDLRNSYPFELEENGKCKIYYPPRKS